jgi:signal transduction histidine kinase
MFQYLILFFIIISSSFFCSSKIEKKSPLIDESFVLDLGSYKFEEFGSFLIQGDWKFFPNAIFVENPKNPLLSPELGCLIPIQTKNPSKRFSKYQELCHDHTIQTDLQNPTLHWQKVSIPHKWNHFITQSNDTLGPHGPHIYAISLKGMKDQELGVFHKGFFYAFRMWAKIPEGYQLICRSGRVARKIEHMQDIIHEGVCSIPMDAEMLVVEMSNQLNHSGFFWDPLELGIYEKLRKSYETKIGYSMAIFGFIMSFSLYNFVLYLMRREDKSSLWLSLVCLNFGIREIIMGRYFQYFFYHLVEDSVYLQKIEYTFLPSSILFFSLFIKEFLPEGKPKKVFKLLTIFSSFLMIFILVSGVQVFTGALVYLQMYTVLSMIIGITSLMIGIQNKLYKRILILNYLVLFVFGVNDILYNLGLIHTGNILPIGQVIFLMGFSFMISLKNNDTWKRAEYLSEKLELDVEKRTQELNLEKSRLERIQKASFKIQNAVNFDEMFSNLKWVFLETYGIHSFVLYTLNHKANRLEMYRFESNFNFPEELISLFKENHLPLDSPKSIHAAVIKNKKPFYIKDTLRFENQLSLEEQLNRDRLNISSILLLPLISNGEVFAILTFSDFDIRYGSKHRIFALTKATRDELALLSQSIGYSLFQSLQKLIIQESQEALSRAERESSINQLAAHMAHEVNNPLNFISTGESIVESTLGETREFIMSAIPDTEESKPFRKKLTNLFNDFQIGLDQIKKGYSRIKETVTEIRAITKVDGIQVRNHNLYEILMNHLELILERNQMDTKSIEIQIEGQEYPNQSPKEYKTISQKEILGRAFRTLLNETINQCKTNPSPKLRIQMEEKPKQGLNCIYVDVYHNGNSILEENEPMLFDLKNQKSIGTELIGLAMVKELLKSIQCNLTLIDHGRESGWVGYQIMVKDFE